MLIKQLPKIILIFGLTVVLMGAGYPEVFFDMKDPVGDDHGYGTYQYPNNVAFKPYQGLFDITQFRVWKENADTVYFDTTFSKITNPWMAPEGFIHQNLRIYIDSIPNQGYSKLPKKGANVEFNPKYAWDICLKIVGWGNSQYLIYDNGTLKCRPLETEVLGDGQTIRAKIPQNLIDIPNKNWNYYVFVGSYDGFGDDFYRKVDKEPGDWVIGGGTAEKFDPLIMDLLAPKSGPNSQISQLKSFDKTTPKLAVLQPVGKRRGGINLTEKIILLIILISSCWYFVRKRFKSISWFWVKRNNQPENTK
ncbi:MAG TPA: glucodextranase DOMON-like domain-containing protein [Bacillota bacterium]|nr:glucodextranase DOMON-like domain-containing protein [Bacillota bacterium]HOL08655.1 glucodextranase DOMON-like domain-containing protein [Bacillota bacterium]HPO96643.1 glucodextranase DOMON-like domain-containing protein [Bacillota bacterium]